MGSIKETRKQDTKIGTDAVIIRRSMNGNPRYKAQEDYFDEAIVLKKKLNALEEENSLLRGKLRQSEELNVRKHHAKCTNPNTVDEDHENPTTLKNLKQRLYKVECQLNEKLLVIDELKRDPRWTKSTEFEIQNRALFDEIHRLKALLYEKQDNFISDEVKTLLKKLNDDNQVLIAENHSLKETIAELKRPIEKSNERFTKLQDRCDSYEKEMTRLRVNLNRIRRQRDALLKKYEREMSRENAARIIQHAWFSYRRSKPRSTVKRDSNHPSKRLTQDELSIEVIQAVIRAHQARSLFVDRMSNHNAFSTSIQKKKTYANNSGRHSPRESNYRHSKTSATDSRRTPADDFFD